MRIIFGFSNLWIAKRRRIGHGPIVSPITKAGKTDQPFQNYAPISEKCCHAIAMRGKGLQLMNASEDSQPIAFISFSNADRATAEAACAQLESKGVKCWIAPRDIAPGVPYAEGIMAGLHSSRVMVLIFSSNANRSPHVQREVERAINRSMPVIPFRIENVPPSSGLEYFLSLPNWLDAFSPPLEQHLQKLEKSVKDLLGLPAATMPAATMPSQPIATTGEKTKRNPAVFALLAFTALAAITWGILSHESSPSTPAPVPTPTPTPVPTPTPTPKPFPVPDPVGNDSAVDFSVPNIQTAPNYEVAAAPYLHSAKIEITAVSPVGSRVVLVNNMGLYNGQAVKPTVSQNMLTQMKTGNVAASFELRFAEPLKAFSFMVPGVWPATESGVTFPAWKAIALSASGEELSSTSLGLLRRYADEPAKTFTLTAPGFEGISAVRFESDPRIGETPFAAFSAILIEQIKLTP